MLNYNYKKLLKSTSYQILYTNLYSYHMTSGLMVSTNATANNKNMILDNKCLFSGDVFINNKRRGNIILSICQNSNSMTGILDIDRRLYSLTQRKRHKNRVKRWAESYFLELIPYSTDERGICGNHFIKTSRGPEVRANDKPSQNFGLVTLNISVSIDELLFRHRFGLDMKFAEEFAVIHMAFLQKLLNQRNLIDVINITIVITDFSIAPYYETHNWSTTDYLQHFCRWSEAAKKADLH
ncbi:unnamed protein product, partial [Medioppia subpectinata]